MAGGLALLPYFFKERYSDNVIARSKTLRMSVRRSKISSSVIARNPEGIRDDEAISVEGRYTISETRLLRYARNDKNEGLAMTENNEANGSLLSFRLVRNVSLVSSPFSKGGLRGIFE